MKLVAGSNIMAWIVAIALKKNSSREKVALVNFGSVFGGNSRSFPFKDQFIDFGMQTFYECGIGWADEIVREALNASNVEYNEYKWPYHDPCVTWQHGRIYNSVYPVHQSDMSISLYKNTFTGLQPAKPDNDCLRDNIVGNFGEKIWCNVFKPIAKKFTVGSLDDLSIVSLAPIPTDRILATQLKDEELLQNPALFSKLAFSDPANIPKSIRKKRSTLYPKKGGIAAIIGALKFLAIKHGVEIYNNLNWEDVSFKNGKIDILELKPAEVFWTLRNKPLFEITGITALGSGPSPFSGTHVGVFCERGFKVPDSHYLLSFDEDPIFRLTFYGNLAGEHCKSYASIELLIAPDKFDAVQITQFLKRSQLIDQDATCEYTTPKFSPWPISFKKGYIRQCAIEEAELSKKITNLVLLNSNPSIGSIMQTPTLSSRLGKFR